MAFDVPGKRRFGLVCLMVLLACEKTRPPPPPPPPSLPPLSQGERMQRAGEPRALAPAAWAACVARRTMRLEPLGQLRLVLGLLEREQARAEVETLMPALHEATVQIGTIGMRMHALALLAESYLRLDARPAARVMADEAVALVLAAPDELGVDGIERDIAIELLAETYARMGVHEQAAALAGRGVRGAAAAALGYGLTGDLARGKAVMPGRSDGSFSARLVIARASVALGAAPGAAVSSLDGEDRGLALIQIAEDAVRSGGDARARVARGALTAAVQAVAGAKIDTRIAIRLRAVELWSDLREDERSRAELARAEVEAEQVKSIYRSAYLTQIVEARAAAGDFDGARALMAKMRTEDLAHLGPAPLALIDIETRGGRFAEAKRVLTANTIGADGYALALLYVRYRKAAQTDLRFEAEMARTLAIYCPRR